MCGNVISSSAGRPRPLPGDVAAAIRDSVEQRFVAQHDLSCRHCDDKLTVCYRATLRAASIDEWLRPLTP
jgi:hypothetical protein